MECASVPIGDMRPGLSRCACTLRGRMVPSAESMSLAQVLHGKSHELLGRCLKDVHRRAGCRSGDVEPAPRVLLALCRDVFLACHPSIAAHVMEMFNKVSRLVHAGVGAVEAGCPPGTPNTAPLVP